MPYCPEDSATHIIPVCFPLDHKTLKVLIRVGGPWNPVGNNKENRQALISNSKTVPEIIDGRRDLDILVITKCYMGINKV